MFASVDCVERVIKILNEVQAETFSEPIMDVYFMITSILTHVGPYDQTFTLVQ